jgi:hypothetical protein
MQKKNLVGALTGIVAILATAAFFILGFTIGSWHLIWLVFLAIPLTAIVFSLFVKQQPPSEKPEKDK